MKWKEYVRQHRGGVLLFILFGGIFSLIAYLYSVPMEGIVYAWLLCGVIGLCAFFIGLARFAARQRALKELAENVALGLMQLPEPKYLLEEEYQLALINLWEDRLREIERRDDKISAMREYYMLWVHQIKTPIAALRLLLREDTPENQERRIELFRIEGYVEMVLSYIRLESESKDWVLRRHTLRPLVQQSLRKYAGLFIQNRMQVELGDLEQEVLTDEKWFCFALEQILSNAVKYTPPGGKVTIFTEPGPVLCIRDTGIGIAPEDLPRIGEKGFTGYSGRSDKKATGLGLYLSRRVLRDLGHALRIESAVGKGTTVRIHMEISQMNVSD